MASHTSPPNVPNSNPSDVVRIVQAIAATLQDGLNWVGDGLIELASPTIAQGTDLLGKTVAPIADFPWVRFATGVPGLSWLLAALGQVNAAEIRQAISDLRVKYPLDSNEQLAQRVIADATVRAAQVGLVTNLLPPLAVLLLAVDMGAIAALQAEMIYRIAAIYGFSPSDARRRGEVLATLGFVYGQLRVGKVGVERGGGAAAHRCGSGGGIRCRHSLRCRQFGLPLLSGPGDAAIGGGWTSLNQHSAYALLLLVGLRP
ncbi:MAG: EcsC family protein [Leptolyngbya sp. RL_3_1]|nr:EcsC family protein [Leptolyngbya sp. RL_3_1]